MFLHSGASLHGHEYSKKPTTNAPPPARRRILLRSSLGASPLSPRASVSTDDAETAPSRTRSLSFQGPSPSPRPSVRRNRPVSDLLPRKELVVRFEEEPTVVGQETQALDGVSEDEGSLLSELSDTSTVKRSKRSRRAARQCTNYLLAYPPPKLRTKQRRFVQIRPRLLLQLQQLSNDKRPMPAIDVLPSSILAGSVILPRLARQFPKMFRVKGQLGMNGLILARSEDYDAPADDSDGDEKDLDKRDLVAVISPLASRREGERRESADQAEIVLADGSVWTAAPTSNGSYDFVHIDEMGRTTTARWARRNARPLSTATCTAATTPLHPSDYKFTFSILDPELRRHPVMATLTSANLEILDNYTTVSQSSGRSPPTRPFSTDLSGDNEPSSPPSSAFAAAERETHPVDEMTRTLITVTSVWVSLRHGQGWASTTSTPAAANVRPVHSRTVSGSSCQTRASTFPVTVTELRQITSPPLAQHQVMTKLAPVVPKRALSSGAAFMQRRQTKLGAEPATTDSTVEIDDAGMLEKIPEPVVLKRSFSRRIRDWGHRLCTKKAATA
ncbi:hypothetical protein CCHL11_04435 [Colletotrichum chlorophyti]|uniref:Uncharacterized protein n=1 Tax=Colletotrichum chlorophyti TaxID=708187 RepID=A0A1Q8S4B7_9PEZI|nr:hypothetical protein CCHL11_04435 [Colletotrichum chlorophyti]